MNYSQLINKTISSNRENITGFYFYNSIKKAWFIVTKSQWFFTSFYFSFGARWSDRQHMILESKRVSSKKSKWLNECSNKKFNEVRV